MKKFLIIAVLICLVFPVTCNAGCVRFEPDNNKGHAYAEWNAVAPTTPESVISYDIAVSPAVRNEAGDLVPSTWESLGNVSLASSFFDLDLGWHFLGVVTKEVDDCTLYSKQVLIGPVLCKEAPAGTTGGMIVDVSEVE